MTHQQEYITVPNEEIIKMMNESKEFRNAVAYAHGCTDTNRSYYFKGTCTYPQRYRVENDMIELALQMIETEKKIVLEQHKNDLYFIGMGWHKADSSGDVGNCRIRTVLQNNDGLNVFIELTSGNNRTVKNDNKHYIVCDYCFIVPNPEGETVDQRFEYNYLDLEQTTYRQKIEWTKENILEFVNKKLNCSFKDIHIDNFDNHLEKYETLCYSK